MTSNTEKPASGQIRGTAPLVHALNQSEQVHEKMERAAVDLTAVNAVLKGEVADGAPPGKVERALRDSEAVEVNVQEAAVELVAVNDALANEVDERHHLEQELSASASALSEVQAEASKAADRALHDPVTGLPNLTLFCDRLRVALAQAERHTWHLAVMFIDLDGFKSVNDSHGHDAGDRLLVTVAERLQTVVRKGDTVSRRSGDEFLFLMLESKDDSEVLALAARIGAKIAEPCDVEGAKVSVKASVGIALYPEDGRSAEELLKSADLAMYAAKREKTGVALFGRLAPP